MKHQDVELFPVPSPNPLAYTKAILIDLLLINQRGAGAVEGGLLLQLSLVFLQEKPVPVLRGATPEQLQGVVGKALAELRSASWISEIVDWLPKSGPAPQFAYRATWLAVESRAMLPPSRVGRYRA